ncbi:MAG: glutamate--tRNA ligase [Firmicutes bacterium]|nr:glutamate--tRNA ligase [Bacillota bacterium]
MDKVRVRIAPSPTGLLNLRRARIALFNYLFTQAYEGTLILRSDDIDQDRSSKAVEQSIYKDLAWLGISWDEGPDKGGSYGPYRQSERTDVYTRFTKRLIEDGFCYHCFCDSRELADKRREMLSHGETPRYTGRCRNLNEEDRARLIADGREPVVRFRTSGSKAITFTDLINGPIEIESEAPNDFIVVKADGLPTYNFAVVLDDHFMGISHVICGDEQLANTTRQVMLYEALGWRPPKFAHLPALTDDEGRLSATVGLGTVEEYRQRGYLPESLANFLLLLGWKGPEKPFFTVKDASKSFRLEQISQTPAIFNPDQLRKINNYYLKSSSPERILELALPYLREAGYVSEPDEDEYAWLLQLAETMRGELDEIAEINERVSFFFESKIEPESKRAIQVLKEEQVPAVFTAVLERLGRLPEFKVAAIRTELRQLCKDMDLTTRRVYLPLRVALTGRLRGAEIFRIIALLGWEQVKARLEAVQKQGFYHY